MKTAFLWFQIVCFLCLALFGCQKPKDDVVPAVKIEGVEVEASVENQSLAVRWMAASRGWPIDYIVIGEPSPKPRMYIVPNRVEVLLGDTETGPLRSQTVTAWSSFSLVIPNFSTNKLARIQVRASFEDGTELLSNTLMISNGGQVVPQVLAVNESWGTGLSLNRTGTQAVFTKPTFASTPNSPVFLGDLGNGREDQIAPNGFSAVFSPDGNQVAYIVPGGTTQNAAIAFYNLQTKQTQTRTLTEQQASSLSWSPDGQWVAFLTGNERVRLWKLSATTEPLVALTPYPELANDTEGINHGLTSWLADGSGVLVEYRQLRVPSVLAKVPLSGGVPQLLTATQPAEWVDRSPVMAPDGRRLAFISSRSGRTHIWLHDLISGNLRQLRFDQSSAILSLFGPLQWLDPQTLVFVGSDGVRIRYFKIAVNG
ncbi:MAG: hypothetical protein EAZ91_21870 [Cytophagales bacterium]|nr:MAG: hypothetical protein EAZ91_21870 [Cytophagales bacterium]